MIHIQRHQSNLFNAWYLTAELKIKDAVTARLRCSERRMRRMMMNYFKCKQYFLFLLVTVVIYSIFMTNSEDHVCHPVSKTQKVMNYSVDHPTCLSFSLWSQSALFRKLDWNVWGLIYRSRMNTWMWSSAIFHTHHPHPWTEYYYRCPRKLRREPFFTWTSITVSCWTLFTMCRAVWHAVKYFLRWPQISAEVGQFPLQLQMYNGL